MPDTARITTIEIRGPVTAARVVAALRGQGIISDEEPPGPASDLDGAAGEDRLLMPAEVAAMFRVDRKTVFRWAQAGKLTPVRTLGGDRRYRESEVRALLKVSG